MEETKNKELLITMLLSDIEERKINTWKDILNRLGTIKLNVGNNAKERLKTDILEAFGISLYDMIQEEETARPFTNEERIDLIKTAYRNNALADEEAIKLLLSAHIEHGLLTAEDLDKVLIDMHLKSVLLLHLELFKNKSTLKA